MENKIFQDQPDISIVLAVYNEELSLAKELEIIKQAMDQSKYRYEVIIVDDHSSDRSYEIANQAKWPIVLCHRKNLGSGGARKTGLKKAKGRLVAWTDTDLSYPNEKIPELIQYLEDHNLDQVIGARDSERGTKKWIRFVAKWFIRKIASILADYDIQDLNSGLRVFKRSIALEYFHLIPNGFSCVGTLTLAFLCNNYAVDFYPISYKTRVGQSKFHPLKDTYNYVIQIVRMIMYFNPLKIILPISLFILFFGMCTMTYNTFWGIGGLQQSDIVIILFGLSIGILGLLADLITTINKSRHQL